MKRIRTKEIILYVLGILFCKVEIADCYPLIPAYFTALYISMESRWLTLGACFVGMACFLPVTPAYQIRSGNGGNYPDHPSDRMGR